MITDSSKKIVNYLIKENVIGEEDWDVCKYGMELLISTILSTVIILGLGIVLQRFVFTIFLVIPFYSIRGYAGGIHAETYTLCITSFTLGFLFTLLGVEYLINMGLQNYIIYSSFFSAIVICIISPIEDHSRPLDVTERKLYQKKTCVITLIYTSLVQIAYELWRPMEIVYIAAAINFILLVLLAGVIKNKIIRFQPLCI